MGSMGGDPRYQGPYPVEVKAGAVTPSGMGTSVGSSLETSESLRHAYWLLLSNNRWQDNMKSVASISLFSISPLSFFLSSISGR